MLFVLFILLPYASFYVFNISSVYCAVLYPHEKYIISTSFFEFVFSQRAEAERNKIILSLRENRHVHNYDVSDSPEKLVRRSCRMMTLRQGQRSTAGSKARFSLYTYVYISVSIALIICIQYSFNICSRQLASLILSQNITSTRIIPVTFIT